MWSRLKTSNGGDTEVVARPCRGVTRRFVEVATQLPNSNLPPTRLVFLEKTQLEQLLALLEEDPA